MADRMLFIGWDAPLPGREERALEVFNEALGILGRMQQDGRIEKFNVALLGPNAGLGGYIQVEGTTAQIAAMRDDEEFRRNTIDAELSVAGIRHIEGVCNEGVGREMTMYQEAIGKVTQLH